MADTFEIRTIDDMPPHLRHRVPALSLRNEVSIGDSVSLCIFANGSFVTPLLTIVEAARCTSSHSAD